MKIAAITKIASFANNSQIDAYLYRLYHGLCVDEHGLRSRVGNRWSHKQWAEMRLIYNVYGGDRIIQPSLNLIVPQCALEKLRSRFKFPDLFIPVEIRKTVEIPYTTGRPEQFNEKRRHGILPDKILLEEPPLETPYEGMLYEVVAPREDELPTTILDKNPKEISFVQANRVGESRLRRKALEKFPIVYNSLVTFMPFDVWLVLKAYMPPAYFEAIEFL